jgi:hypothetical protein
LQQTSTIYELSGGSYLVGIVSDEGLLIVTLINRLAFNLILAVPVIAALLLYGPIGGILAAAAIIGLIWYFIRRTKNRIKSLPREDLPRLGQLGFRTEEVPWEQVYGADVSGRLLTIRLGQSGRRQITLHVPEADMAALTSFLNRKLGDRLIMRA